MNRSRLLICSGGAIAVRLRRPARPSPSKALPAECARALKPAPFLVGALRALPYHAQPADRRLVRAFAVSLPGQSGTAELAQDLAHAGPEWWPLQIAALRTPQRATAFGRRRAPSSIRSGSVRAAEARTDFSSIAEAALAESVG